VGGVTPVGDMMPWRITTFPTIPTNLTGSTVMGTNAIASTSCQPNATGPDVSYWFFTCPNFTSRPLNASTCSTTSFDTVLTINNASTVAACADDTSGCGTQSTVSATLPAGSNLYTLTLDGWNGQSGAYTIAHRFAP
jgi:hypothetical protein